jgi:hypothetical protein
LNICEEGGSWYNDGYTSDGHFVGGLGMSVEAWAEGIRFAAVRGVDLPASANSATPFEQMEGAQAFYDGTSGGGWACPV